ncbi:hypothetical protein [Staphylococcus epidermidis]|uniref:hypothetical protein n=1 Tax=Staphylococcus epidermidis TaxID=1282 RepID=UPI00124E5275|nr:hypothetical protein [Staphylococcus epidermidis]KAB2169887.1 hypothetical protein F9B37_04875 [Staphylococcus epidermidis]
MIELKIYTHIKPFFTRGWGPNKENFTEKFNKQSKLGMGPNKENFTEKFNKQSKLGMGPNKENFTVNSTFLAPLFD